MNISKHHSPRWFSLIELLVVLCVLAVLAALLLVALRQAKEKSGQVTCLNNLRNLGLAIQLFKLDTQTWPRGPLEDQLATAMNGRTDAFYCPATGVAYDAGFVARETDENEGYVMGCPYHHLAGFTLGQGTQLVIPGKIQHNGTALKEGVEVTGGTLTFADDSKVVLSGKATVLASFRIGNGPLYTVLRVFENDGTTVIDSDVNPGSRFEVVTPAAIAGVAGTKFKVTATYDSTTNESSTVVSVTQGKVKVTGRKGAAGWEPKLVDANGQASRSASSSNAQKNPNPRRSRN